MVKNRSYKEKRSVGKNRLTFFFINCIVRLARLEQKEILRTEVSDGRL